MAPLYLVDFVQYWLGPLAILVAAAMLILNARMRAHGGKILDIEIGPYIESMRTEQTRQRLRIDDLSQRVAHFDIIQRQRVNEGPTNL